jgi:hypothetical protein
MIEATCHCGAVVIAVPSAPVELTSCNCSICRRLGGLWCYFDPTQVTITGQTVTYIWGDKMLALHHCGTCGCSTHWTPIGETRKDRMGVNARLMDPSIVAAARVKRVDGAADTWAVLE